MWPDQEYAPSRGSFTTPVLPPSTDPRDSPTKTVEVNCQWLPYIRGALMQLVLQATWIPTDVGFTDIQMRAMTLIDLFKECDTSVLPIACPYPFFGGDTGGWDRVQYASADGSCPPYSAIFTGTAYESCTRPPGYDQINLIKALNQRLVAMEVVVTSAFHTEFDLNDRGSDTYPYGSNTLLVGGGDIPPGTEVHATFAVGADVSNVQLVLTNSPADSSHNSLIILHEVNLILENSSGECP